MARLTLSDVSRGTQLLKEVVRRADVKGDGAIREGDTNAFRRHNGLRPSNQTWNDGSDAARVLNGINAAVDRAQVRGGPSIERLDQAIDELEANVRRANRDGNRTLSAAEQATVRGTGEKKLLDFIIWAKGKSIDDVDFPTAHAPERPRFNWRGTPDVVAKSLLDSTTSSGNDSYWPSWAHGDGPSRYYVGADEARAMIAALRPLYASRQKAVLSAIAARTEQSAFGCVFPTNAAKRALEAYADTLGLTLNLGQPPPPAMPSPT